jgi:hypothetical protein
VKKLLTTALILVMALSLFPFSALAAAAPTAEDLKTPPSLSNLEIHDDGEGFVWLEVTVETPANVLNAIDYYENHELGYNQAGYIGGIELQYAIDGADWSEAAESGLAVAWRYYEDADEVPRWNGIHETYYLDELHVDSQVKARARYTGADAEGNVRCSDWSNVLTLNEPVDFQAHNWAKAELEEADKLGLIPDCLKGADLTQPITRAEFAAVSVKLFEAMSYTKASPAPADTFSDTSDPEVLKAFALGVTNGTDSVKKLFSPDTFISREQTATMLTRVYKKLNLSGWTLETDSSFGDAFRALFTRPEPFADDGEISSWAKDSVYFMAANGIVNGVGDNRFAPKLVQSGEETLNHATREQALLMSVRTVNNLG